MKYTESWTWTKTPMIYGQWDYNTFKKLCIRHKWELQRRYKDSWMQDYRDKIQAIDTDEKAAQAIREYWLSVVQDWQDHLKGAPMPLESIE